MLSGDDAMKTDAGIITKSLFNITIKIPAINAGIFNKTCDEIAYKIEMVLGAIFTSSFLGRKTFKTPFSYLASIASAFMFLSK